MKARRRSERASEGSARRRDYQLLPSTEERQRGSKKEGGRAADRAGYYVDRTRFGNIIDKRDLKSVLHSKEDSSEDIALRQRQQVTKGKHQNASECVFLPWEGKRVSGGRGGRDDVI